YGLSPVVGDDNGVPLLLEYSDCQLLIDRVVFCQKNSKRLLGLSLEGAADRRPAGVEGRGGQGGDKSVKQIRLREWLGQVARQPQLPASSRITALPARGQHHYRRQRKSGAVPYLFRDSEAVDSRHLSVKQDEGQRVAGSL